MVITKNDIFVGSFVATAVITTAMALVEMARLHKATKKLDVTVEKLTDKDIDISEEIIETSVKRAAEREARYQVNKAMEKAAKDVVREFESKISTAVEEEFKLQRDDVAKTLKRKISDIDISEIKRQVKMEAKQACLDKIKGDLDDLSDKYTEQIESMASIYETVANKIQSIGD